MVSIYKPLNDAINKNGNFHINLTKKNGTGDTWRFPKRVCRMPSHISSISNRGALMRCTRRSNCAKAALFVCTSSRSCLKHGATRKKCAKVQFWIRNSQGTLVVRLKNKITRSTWFGVELRDVESRRWLWLVNLQMRCSTLLGWVKGC